MKNSWRNNIITFSILAIAGVAQADTLESHLAKLKSVVEKDGRCEFAVAQVPIGSYKDESRFWPKQVACIGYIVADEGTMKERSGCGAFYLNSNNLSTTGVGSEGRMKITNGKKCNDGGFEEVMGYNLYGYVDEAAGSTNGVPNMEVGWIYYDGSRAPDITTAAIVYSKKPFLGSSKYETWWNQKHSEALAKDKASTAKHKLEEQKAKEDRVTVENKEKLEQAEKRKKQKKADALWKE